MLNKLLPIPCFCCKLYHHANLLSSPDKNGKNVKVLSLKLEDR